MQLADKDKFDELFIRVNRMFIAHYEIDEGVAKSFFKLLSDFDLDTVIKAFEQYVKSYKSEPKPAHIIEQCKEIIAEQKEIKKQELQQQQLRQFSSGHKITDFEKKLDDTKNKIFAQDQKTKPQDLNCCEREHIMKKLIASHNYLLSQHQKPLLKLNIKFDCAS